MKNKISVLILFCLATILSTSAHTQTQRKIPEGFIAGSSSVGTTAAPNSKAVLDVVSTTKGFLPPRMTTTQRDAITSPPTGLVIFNTTTNTLNQYNGSAWSTVGGGGGGLYAASQNLLLNSSWETDTSSWTASGGTYTRTTTAANIIPPGVGAGSWDSSSASQTLTASSTTITADDGISKRSLAGSCAIKAASGTATHKIQIHDGTNVISESTITSTTTGFARTSINGAAPSSGTVTLRLISVASDEPTIYVDDCYLGLAEGFNVSSVSQAQVLGSVRYAATTNCTWTSSGAIANFATDSDCPSPTVWGKATAPSTKVPGIRFQGGIPQGEIYIVATGSFVLARNANSADTFWRFSDGTNTTSRMYLLNFANSAASTNQQYVSTVLSGRIPYTSAQGDTTIQIQAGSGSGTGSVDVGTGDLEITVYHFPSQSELAYRPDQLPAAPTVQRFTSGSGTYTLPTNPRPSYIRVRMAGGGGGGGGSGTTAGTASTDGGNTTFGSSLLTANGGKGGSNGTSQDGTGGTVTVNSPAISVVAQTGGKGGNGISHNGSVGGATPALSGGDGGSNLFGGNGTGGGVTSGTGGSAGVANTGGGGGGAYMNQVSLGTSGSGGGAGGYIEAIIANPSATYTYSVGSGGTGQGAGTSGTAGSNGGSGVIIVEEYYGASPAPLLVGSLTYGTTVMSGGASGVNTFESGTYSPTLTNGTNIAASTTQQSFYMRIGNLVWGHIRIQADTTSAAATSSNVDVSLPIASNFTGTSDLHGACTSESTTAENHNLYADSTNDRMEMVWNSNNSANQNIWCSYMYIVK